MDLWTRAEIVGKIKTLSQARGVFAISALPNTDALSLDF